MQIKFETKNNDSSKTLATQLLFSFAFKNATNDGSINHEYSERKSFYKKIKQNRTIKSCTLQVVGSSIFIYVVEIASHLSACQDIASRQNKKTPRFLESLFLQFFLQHGYHCFQSMK